ncbi:basic amino acid ABC transporter substrate-binding protein [Pullulanibacillus sp. KACC 23026]|uniref:basic amino acid ABC transporter substrate-binding protein n=1 Tax=Pullulanibacillus sp. KACC 23026 TaxID=3028315 RepID=UPI0023B02D05|nr:basic amino acid ABC transporter substrate-binding protein [Pullulanibacillus sp. KACC 23026]WEG13171.1 basic amino acid ABC transporter substrate-binding protein [Pullulanibacillus sp. KACC 23026]
MKKSFSLVMALLIMSVIMLAGCGTSSNNGSSSTKSEKTLHVVTDASYAPFENMDNGKMVGFDVDIMNAVAKDAGYKVKMDNVGWDAAFAALEGNNADAGISAITINNDRKQTYDFSLPYFQSKNEILIKDGSTISSGKDLKGKTIAVQNATTGQTIAEGILGKNSSKIKKFDTTPLAIQEMLNNGADAVVADSGVVQAYVKNNPDQKLKIVDDPSFPSEYYGIMFPKGSKLVPAFNKAIKKIISDGTYAKIYKANFGKDPDLAQIKAEQAKAE